jgi:hypothetical protein
MGSSPDEAEERKSKVRLTLFSTFDNLAVKIVEQK